MNSYKVTYLLNGEEHYDHITERTEKAAQKRVKRSERRSLRPSHPGGERLPQEAEPRPSGGRRQTRANGRRQQQ